MESLFGYDRAELVGQRVEMLVPERFRGRIPATAPGSRDPVGRPMGAGWTCTACAKTAVSSRSRSACPLEATGERLYCAAVRDVGDRRAAEQHTRDLADVVESSHEPSCR